MKQASANDNIPSGHNTPEGAVLERHAPAPMVLSTKYTKRNYESAVQNGNPPKRRKTGGRIPVLALVLLWLIFAATIARFAGSEEGNLLTGNGLIIAVCGFGLTSLWLASLSRRRDAKISHSLGIAGTSMSISGLAWQYFSAQSGIMSSLELIVMGLAATSLVLAKLWRTPFLLHFSMFLMIGWSSYVFMNTQISDFVWLFPALWSLQMLLAIDFRIKRSIALCVFSGLLWIGINLFLLA